MNTLAPVGICTYTRIEKLRLAIDALKFDALAQQSELFIFSDAARTGDESKVDEIRRYISAVQGFKKVTPVFQEKNDPCANTYTAYRKLTSRFGKSIFLEDDIVVSPHYLTFMNKALDVYKDDLRVFSVGGYVPHGGFATGHNADTVFSKIYCPWGAGIWENRLRLSNIVDWTGFFSDHQNRRAVSSQLSYLGKQISGRFLRWCERGVQENDLYRVGDLIMTIIMMQQGMVTVLPRKSLVRNIGLDSSGMHTSGADSKRYEITLDSSFIPQRFASNAIVTKDLDKELYLLNSYSKKKSGLSRLYYLMSREIKYLRYRLSKPDFKTSNKEVHH